jgi:hypothetical protein
MPDLVPHPLEILLSNRWIVNHLEGPIDERWRDLIAEAGYSNKILDARKVIQAEIDEILGEPIDVDRLIRYQRMTQSEHTWMMHPRKKFIEFLRYIHRLCDQPRLTGER